MISVEPAGPVPSSHSGKSCRTCRHFVDAPSAIEAALPGLTSFSSAYAAVRSDDGICALHDRYVGADSVCADASCRHGRPSSAGATAPSSPAAVPPRSQAGA